jgi:hypothetical protein
MDSLLRHAWEQVAAVTPQLTAPPSLQCPGSRSATDRLRQQTSSMRQGTGTGTVRRSRTDQGVSPGARMPGRANGSILSLVNRAVKSNILIKSWHTEAPMVLKYDEDVQRACMRCTEWEAKWQVRAELLCKWCDWQSRSIQVATPAWLAEVVPLE